MFYECYKMAFLNANSGGLSFLFCSMKLTFDPLLGELTLIPLSDELTFIPLLY